MVYYNGWYKYKNRFIFECNNKTEGRYYYRVKALSEVSESSWSNIIDVIVDYLPEIPKEFTAEVFPEGNALNLSWKPNTEDTTEYELYYNTAETFGWVHLVTIPHPNNFFNNIGLTNGKSYNYTIRAKDSRGQYSDFSSIINAVPLDSLAPQPPVGLIISTITGESIELSWSAGRDRDIVGYNIYRNTTPILNKGEDLIGTTKIGELFLKMMAWMRIPNIITGSQHSTKYQTNQSFPRSLTAPHCLGCMGQRSIHRFRISRS